MTAASRVSFDVSYGLAVHRPQSLVKLVTLESNPAPPSWVERLMGMRGRPLKQMKSAWDGIDDPFGEDVAQVNRRRDEEIARLAEANRRQDELNARLAAERHEKALDELQDLEGYGSF